MLVLSRKVNERVHIGEEVSIVVTQIRGDKVRLGIEAPKEIKVLRDELGEANNPKHGRDEAA